MQPNPLVADTAAPPIPAAKAWAARYRGGEPLIDLSQAVPGYPPSPELLVRLAEAAGSREAASYGDIVGDTGLRERYADHVAALYGGGVLPEEVAIRPLSWSCWRSPRPAMPSSCRRPGTSTTR